MRYYETPMRSDVPDAVFSFPVLSESVLTHLRSDVIP